jgi:hypothetical protein
MSATIAGPEADAIRDRAKGLLAEGQAILERAKAAGKVTDADKARVTGLLAEADRLKADAERLELTGVVDAMQAAIAPPTRATTKGFADTLLAAGLARKSDDPAGGLDVKAGARSVEIPGFPIYGKVATRRRSPTSPAGSSPGSSPSARISGSCGPPCAGSTRKASSRSATTARRCAAPWSAPSSGARPRRPIRPSSP